jgi:hypothetical protein
LNAKLADIPPAQRAQLTRLPLWTSQGWYSRRPLYAFEDETIAIQAAVQVPVWHHDFTSLNDLALLVDALGVKVLSETDFVPYSHTALGAVSAQNLQSRFAVAVQHLRDELAKGDLPLHDSLTMSWSDLSAAQVIVEHNLRLAAQPAIGHEISVAAEAHFMRQPLALFVRSDEAAGAANGGGRAIASLFSGDRLKVAWAWAAMWQRASVGIAPDGFITGPTSTDTEGAEGTNRLIQLQGQATKRAGRIRSRARKVPLTTTSRMESLTVRKLKVIAEFEPDHGVVVNQGKANRRAVFLSPSMSAKSDNRRTSIAGPAEGTNSAVSQPRRTVLPPNNEREQLALDVVTAALRLNAAEIVDLRQRRGIGADAMDELRQFYEIKMSSSGMPDDVSLTREEAVAASNPDFFLAVVSGLEDTDTDLTVRFIFDPLVRLTQRIAGGITLTGVRDAEALEYRFRELKPKAP